MGQLGFEPASYCLCPPFIPSILLTLNTNCSFSTQIVPSTLKRQTRAADPSKMPRQMSQREGGRGAEDRSSYRRGPPQGADKKADVGAGSTEVEFKGGYGGFGRGKAPPQ